ncbi:hypothetical protein [Nonomuraea sp. SYSU D8015]|uniref:hypothetical protein n=1 Tax=Nonomuraea sp. SYSU D8015 TaxID=2593644 RepID=UPI0016607875|nr:hypothetical protein [Nonomuraea sp. SYSU D8015]
MGSGRVADPGLATELGPQGVRVACLNTAGMPETAQLAEVYGCAPPPTAHRRGAPHPHDRPNVQQAAPTVAEIAGTVVFVASDRGNAISGAIVNLTGGTVVD